MLTHLTKAPFPYFGGKRDAAPLVWTCLGDVDHYAEPFVGSGAMLLERPHPCNRPYYSETINDADGFIVNVHRSLALHPHATAEAASWPVTECAPAGTLIATPHGEIPIEQIRPGMVVLGDQDGHIVPTPVTAITQNVAQALYRNG